MQDDIYTPSDVPVPVHKVTLTKITSTHNELRTSVINGECYALPTPGERFTLYALPLELPDGFRYIQTSPVTALEPDGKFTTRNSTYHLKVHA